MIRINGTELNAHGYVSTAGMMELTFETDKSLDEIATLFDSAKTAEVYDSYAVKLIDSIAIQGTNPRKIKVQLSVGGVNDNDEAVQIDDVETVQELVKPTTLEEYADAVASGQMMLSDVPADLRDKVAIKLGV